MMAENIKEDNLAWLVKCKLIQKYCLKLSHGKKQKMNLSTMFVALSKETDILT